MLRLTRIFYAILLIALGSVCIVYARSREVYLLPSSHGEPDKIIPCDDKASLDWLIQYDRGVLGYYLRGLLPGDTLGIFFEPPAACSLVEVHFCKYRYEEGDAPIYWGLIADVPDGITLDDYQEYHFSTSIPGPSPVGDIFAQAEFDFPYTGDWQWDTLAVPTTPDIGTDAFWAGTVIGDTTHSTRIDAAVSPPYHATCWKQGGAGPATNGPGWYSSWHLFWVRALVRVYGNIAPSITMDILDGTYNAGNRLVNIYTEDFDPDTSTLGMDDITLYYVLEGSYDTMEVAVIQDSVQYQTPGWEYAWWHAYIPGQLPETKVTYWVEGHDKIGASDTTSEHWYRVKAGTPGNRLLYVEGDDWFGPGTGVHNAFAGKPYDVWNEIFDNPSEIFFVDTTVLNYYIKGVGNRAISWLSFFGHDFAEFTWTQAFMDYMDNGGCIFISSQDLIYGYFGWLVPPEWHVAEGSPCPIRVYLKAHGGNDDYIFESPFQVTVYNTDLLTEGMPDELIVDLTPLYYTWVGMFEELDSLCVPLFFDEEGNVLGYRYEDPELHFKVVWLYFPFHAITDTVAQNTFIENLTTWFEIGIEEETEEFTYMHPRITPNPLSCFATLSFTIPKNEQLSIKIYDVTGSLVRTLVNDRFTAGRHTIAVRTDEFSSGVYFLRMEAGGFSGTEKFLVVR